MTIEEFIVALEKIKAEHGNLSVFTEDNDPENGGTYESIPSVCGKSKLSSWLVNPMVFNMFPDVEKVVGV